MSRIKEHECHKAAPSDRNSVVAQARMKNIASLPADNRVSKMNRKAGTVAPSSDEEDDIQQLPLVESKLLAHDPTFCCKNPFQHQTVTVPMTFTDTEKACTSSNPSTRDGTPPVKTAQDAAMDAWRGMATFANTEEFKDVGVTRRQNKEWGSKWIKRWWGGNWNAAQ
ncbi:hypothetical protein F5J12DRAFT_935127 [Pisolithus orientalis]|uniref:uncharacterized protein n=1 Tax=Pisolithus orientalis TaxID=936130 RepID=UPI00222418EF|nr:uncharacterized protein F5J12DRAFT_935123 [Pisolithus orientalis]XP_051594360.1 uncharacterized protein F5J12DRAFT_935127 [Pisolithus orientalis]KAI5985686.1 hypothetical protein F5J12DRAFT_935123 [Pisolithus orientalis]KAI5985690.1 hypothetical protein F5J12DRAFT_935127 [Pisolithus orientalis]